MTELDNHGEAVLVPISEGQIGCLMSKLVLVFPFFVPFG